MEQWLLTLLLRLGTCHFCSHFIGQSESQAKLTSVGQGSILPLKGGPESHTAMVKLYKTQEDQRIVVNNNWPYPFILSA